MNVKKLFLFVKENYVWGFFNSIFFKTKLFWSFILQYIKLIVNIVKCSSCFWWNFRFAFICEIAKKVVRGRYRRKKYIFSVNLVSMFLTDEPLPFVMMLFQRRLRKFSNLFLGKICNCCRKYVSGWCCFKPKNIESNCLTVKKSVCFCLKAFYFTWFKQMEIKLLERNYNFQTEVNNQYC